MPLLGYCLSIPPDLVVRTASFFPLHAHSLISIAVRFADLLVQLQMPSSPSGVLGLKSLQLKGEFLYKSSRNAACSLLLCSHTTSPTRMLMAGAEERVGFSVKRHAFIQFREEVPLKLIHLLVSVLAFISQIGVGKSGDKRHIWEMYRARHWSSLICYWLRTLEEQVILTKLYIL